MNTEKHKNINDCISLGIDCLEQIEVLLKSFIGMLDIVSHQALKTTSVTELIRLRDDMIDFKMVSGRIRFALKNLEKHSGSIVGGINKKSVDLREKPQEPFYKPKMKDVVEDVKCPHCQKININFKYGEPCQHCHELIADPWKEHTICPKCHKITNTADIIKDGDAFELDAKEHTINCCHCRKRFAWKQHVAKPRAHGLKYCVICDMPYIPDKRNWQRQRLCQNCKDKGKDVFYLENPTYQNHYRKKKMKKK